MPCCLPRHVFGAPSSEEAARNFSSWTASRGSECKKRKKFPLFLPRSFPGSFSLHCALRLYRRYRKMFLEGLKLELFSLFFFETNCEWWIFSLRNFCFSLEEIWAEKCVGNVELSMSRREAGLLIWLGIILVRGIGDKDRYCLWRICEF